MKLIIDIPEDVVESAKSSPNYYPTYHFEKIWRAIASGIPLDKITEEIKEKFGGCDICEWFSDYDYEENDISEYRGVGTIDEIIGIIERHKKESGDKE